MLTQEKLKAAVLYDPDAGVFTWRQPTGRKGRGSDAGSATYAGYRRIQIDGVAHHSHRLAWLYVTGRWPSHVIDHINGIRNDNRFCNLREATPQQNSRNKRVARKSASGFKGVYWHKGHGSWCAEIWVSGVKRHLGYFDNSENAAGAYQAAEKTLFGAFASVRNAL